MAEGGRIAPGGHGRPAPPAPVHMTVVDTEGGPDAFKAACNVPAPWRSTSITDQVTCLNCRASRAYARALPSPRHAGGPQAVLDRIEAGGLSQWVGWQAGEILGRRDAIRAYLAEFGHGRDCVCPVCRDLAITAALLEQIVTEANR
jgi:hypothetical protein